MHIITKSVRHRKNAVSADFFFCFIMKRIYIIVITIMLILVVSVICLVKALHKRNVTIERLQYNQTALSESLQSYKTESDLSAYYVKRLTQTVSEFKENNATLLQRLNDAQIKIRDLESVVDFEQKSNYKILLDTVFLIDTITLTRKPTLAYSDKWIDVQIIDNNCNITTRDSIIIINHCKTRKFLFWTWKRYSGQTTIINANPYSKIQDITTIDLEK